MGCINFYDGGYFLMVLSAVLVLKQVPLMGGDWWGFFREKRRSVALWNPQFGRYIRWGVYLDFPYQFSLIVPLPLPWCFSSVFAVLGLFPYGGAMPLLWVYFCFLFSDCYADFFVLLIQEAMIFFTVSLWHSSVCKGVCIFLLCFLSVLRLLLLFSSCISGCAVFGGGCNILFTVYQRYVLFISVCFLLCWFYLLFLDVFIMTVLWLFTVCQRCVFYFYFVLDWC